MIFTSIKSELDGGYDEMAIKMKELAKKQSGFLGLESARNTTERSEMAKQLGVTISYWKDLESKKKMETKPRSY